MIGTLLVSGCQVCEPDETKCEGNNWLFCATPEDQPRHWSSWSCGACVKAKDGRAICALSATPDEVCLAGRHCRDNHMGVRCDEGYAVEEYDCATRYCVEETDRCVFSSTKEPLCDGAVHACLSAGEWIGCDHGYVWDQLQCPNGTTCLNAFDPSENWKVGVCSLLPTLDPRCRSDAAHRQDAYCDGTRLFACFLGYQVEIYQCTSDCVTNIYGSSCTPGYTSEVGTGLGIP
jgi:hypothetical protein